MIYQGTVLVYGGGGLQGRPIVKQLKADGFQVRVLTRQGAQPFVEHGVETAVGAFDDAESLIRATASVSHVVMLLPLVFDIEAATRWTRNVVQAAVRAGVRRLTFDTSAPLPDARTGVPAIDVRIAAEEIVRASSVPWTIVRPTVYLGNLTAPWSAPGIVRDRVVAYPLAPDAAVSWISWEDAAVAVSRALQDPALVGKTLDIGGQGAFTGPELAAAFSEALGAGFSYAPIPLDAFEAGLNQAFGPPVGTEIARLYGWLAGDGRALVARARNDNALVGLRATKTTDWIKAQDWGALIG